ncbi:uncharacterized protein [Rutidosis leptorrhynchoides]|uniref:uncharacterized protein n=1 Tax=Rutidosis leptorrhynchoides TaxID=125765 RepID=UPI003A99FC9B
MISGFSFTNGREDRWNWKLCRSGSFSTQALSNLLMDSGQAANGSTLATLRNKLVPKKVSIFVWRVRRERIPVLSQLDKRGIDLHSVRCPLCGDVVETVEHALFLCPKVWVIWVKVFTWWGMGSLPRSLDSLLDESSYSQFSDMGAKIWQGVIWTCVYLIWKNRNQMVFSKKCWTPPVALCDIQLKSFEWIGNRCKVKKLEWLDWLCNPQVLLL